MHSLFRMTATTMAVVLTVANFSSPTIGQEPSHYPTIGSIERLDPALDQLIAEDAVIERLADGLDWSEGPVWIPADQGKPGFLVFSDVPRNHVLKWSDANGLTEYLKPSGYTGPVERGGESGSNGLTLDPQGRLVLCQHGDRRVARMTAPCADPKPIFETLADRYDGKKFNSPNDLVFDSQGRLYFTDPPYGLEKKWDDPKKELDCQGVYLVTQDGTVTRVVDDLVAPNGIAISPDEKTLYVAQSHAPAAHYMAYPIHSDGTVGVGRIFFDATPLVGRDRPGMPDGIKVDDRGILWATGPGGVLVLSPEGKHLGTIRPGQATANCALTSDRKTLYMTSDMFLCRVHLK